MEEDDGPEAEAAGTENPTTVDVGRRDLEDDALSDDCTSCAHVFFFGGGWGAVDVEAASGG